MRSQDKIAMHALPAWDEEALIGTYALCSDARGERVAFSARVSLPSEQDVVQAPGIQWYTVVDVHTGKAIVVGPRRHEVSERVEDYVIG